MSKFNPLRQVPDLAPYGSNDCLVIFGEVFSRGYVNGLIDEANRKGMKIIYSTVGRRDSKTNELRKLNANEINEKSQSPIINEPLEAGFDYMPWSDGRNLIDRLTGYKMSQWKDISIDQKELDQVILKSREDFNQRVQVYVQALEKELPKDGHIIFAHTMAGGIPRAKIVMPCMNRVFKGSGERFQSSKEFWESELGLICKKSFDEVSAQTLQALIDGTNEIREEREANNFHVSYLAFGYHGCDTYVEKQKDYIWQSYAPYLQGWAKIKLEDIATENFKKGINAGVFNAPEILTNSSSVFLGLEVCLYQLLTALKHEGLNPKNPLFKSCEAKLKDSKSLQDIEDFAQGYLNDDATNFLNEFEEWPQHNSPEQMAKMKEASAELIAMHSDSKNLCTQELSEVVFKACGGLMLNKSFALKKPVWWLGHDIVAKWTIQRSSL